MKSILWGTTSIRCVKWLCSAFMQGHLWLNLCTYCSLYMCKLKLRHTANTHIKAASILFYTVKLSLFSKGVAVYQFIAISCDIQACCEAWCFDKRPSKQGVQAGGRVESALCGLSWAKHGDVTFLSKQSSTMAFFSFSNTINLWNQTAVRLEIKFTIVSVHFISTR